jgi:hypothetical protein
MARPPTRKKPIQRWQLPLQVSIRLGLYDNAFWTSILEQNPRTHLAVLVEPYLSLILTGKKTIESRFSRTRRVPYETVAARDVIVMKRSAGPLAGIALIEQTWFFDLHKTPLESIKRQFAAAMAVAEDDFWDQRESMRYATLIRLSHVTPLPPLTCFKRDQRAWVTLNPIDPKSSARQA